jgi:hypothetical protein
MGHLAPNPDSFFHVRIIIGMVTGLSVARLLNGLSCAVQHPRRVHLYGVHLGWAFFLLLAIMHFWWFEFALVYVEHWTFELYFFVICYAALYFFICAIMFPDKMEEYSGFEEYFYSRQKWFYGLIASFFIVDMIDTALKGADHFRSLGLEYPIRQGVLLLMALIATKVTNRRYHLTFVNIALIAEIWWIVSQFNVLS